MTVKHILPKKKELRTREEVLLALIAGEEVDQTTRQMTPPLGVSVSEELLLKIADRLDNLDNGGGSGNGGFYWLTYDSATMGFAQSYNDIKAAMDAGKVCVFYSYHEDLALGIKETYFGYVCSYGFDPNSPYHYVVKYMRGDIGSDSAAAEDPDAPLAAPQ